VFENLNAVAGITYRITTLQLQYMYLPIGGAIGTAVDSQPTSPSCSDRRRNVLQLLHDDPRHAE
jgi:hypothetical protein